jgi:5-formyltetrahydrofolate cyclo-ligase
MGGDLTPSKRALRAEARERRRIMTSDERARSEAGFLENLKQLVGDLGATRISCYLNTVDEPPTRAFLDWASGKDIDVLLPISREDGLMDWAHYGDGDEAPDALGLPAPTSSVEGPMAVHDVDVMIIPAALVSRSGGRLGWGRGYFDRTLGSMETRPPVFAVVYDHEVVDSVPTEPHDQTIDGVVTPTGIHRFSNMA